ncbi:MULTISPECIES: plasmid recombination protein [unclassified Bacillus cereus group]|uniref:plasmid recombination protein n=1 Tax=unclassified Bacillus cereus group TaxID=2750818 RepID=UPI0022E8ED71|nr:MULTISPECIES: plasmid recombination protein [unclassified Bacillus cereus group]MDA1647692.1 plasmid recombination protein [Bacillus cereus group sp. TH163-1LC]MDA1797662.1 plasmid recombination protein [Bacillus cereus group sp. BY8-1LC]
MLFSISFNQSHQSSLSHNNRENIHGNPGIDPSRLEENFYFVQKDIRSVYKDVFQEAVDKYNEKQKRNDRKIKDYYDKIKKDTKTHEQRELVVAIGEGKDDPNYREAKKEALKQYAEAFQGRNPNLAVYNMVLHDDEANPHLHINYVPNFESSRGLTRRVGMDRALQQQGVQGKGTELIANWRQLETAYIESLAKEQIPNFERANVGSHKYMKVRQYKEYAEAVSNIENQFMELSKQLPNNKIMLKTKKKEIKTEVKPKLIGKPEIIEKETGNYVFSPKQLEKVEELITAAVTVKKDYERLQNTDLVKENRELNRQVDSLYDSLKESQKINLELKEENRKLNTEIGSLKIHIKDLKENIRVLYQQTKKAFKEKFKVFRGIVKNELDSKGIDNQFEREHKREISKHRHFDRER